MNTPFHYTSLSINDQVALTNPELVARSQELDRLIDEAEISGDREAEIRLNQEYDRIHDAIMREYERRRK